MIVTRQNRIPFLWVIMAMLPWAFWYFQMQVNGVNFFILNRLINNPATLTFVLGLPGLLFTIIPLGAYISYKSDRIWTRWGRRKIFLIVAFSGWILVFILYPLAPNIWFFVGLMFVMSFFGTFGAPLETLKLEIIPPYLRGRSAAMWTWITTSLNIVFYSTILGRIDEVVPFMHFHLGGEKVLFWSAGLAVIVVLFIYLFGIHEIDPKSTITGEKFRIGTVWKALTMPQLRYLYVFGFATTMLSAGLGPMGQLLYLNQWGYSVQEMGFNIAVGGVINLFLIPIVGIFADMGKKNRMAIYLSCLAIILTLNVCYFCYVTFYLPDQRPSLVEIIFFGETTCVFGIVAGMVYYPLVYDYIPRNIMGTYVAGAGILGSIIGFLTLNGLGLFMLAWAHMFQPPAGEMVRICLQKEMSKPQVQQILRSAGLQTPQGKPAVASDIVAKAWYANGIVQSQGECYEVRHHDSDADNKMKRRDELKSEIGVLEAKLKDAKEHNASPESIAKREAELAADNKEHDTLAADLDARAAAWQKQVEQANYMMKDGSEVLGTKSAQAIAFTLPTSHKPKDVELDKLNRQMRAGDGNIVDLRAIVRPDRGFALSICTLLPDGKDAKTLAGEDCRQVMALAAKTSPGLIAADAVGSEPVAKAAELEDIALVEDPVRNFISPISRVVNFVISQFTEVPPPDQKLHSLARNLCKDEQIAHARADTLSGRNGLHIIAVADSAVLADPASWRARLLKDLRTEGASLKLTVLTPVVGNGIVPMQYNYMTGYIYVFVMVLIGFSLIRWFIRLEKAGKVSKLGAAEAHAEEQHHKAKKEAAEAAEINGTAPSSANDSDADTYTPGYLVPKLLFVAFSLAVFAVGLLQAWPDLKLLVNGQSTEGVVTAVIMHKEGLPEIVLNTQAELIAKTTEIGASKDYGWTFYDQFTFESGNGQQATFRRDVGCKLRPPLPLLDDSGLPTTAMLRYDPANPSMAMLPLESSTWFASVLICILGLGGALTGGVLAWFARKPIVLHSSVSVNLVPAAH